MFTLLCLLRRRWCGLPCLPVMLLVMSKYFLVCCLQSWALCAALCPAQHTAVVAAYLCIASYLVRMRCFLPHPCACMAAYLCVASYLIARMAAHFCIPTIATRGVHNDIVRTDCKRHAMLLGSPRSKLKLKHRAMQRCNNSALYQKDQPPPSLNPAINHHGMAT